MYRHFRYIWCIQLEEDFLDEADACLKNIAHSRVQQWREREDPAYIMSVMHSSAASRVTSSGPHVSIYDEVYLLLVWFMDHNNSGLIEIFVWWWSLPLIHLLFHSKGVLEFSYIIWKVLRHVTWLAHISQEASSSSLLNRVMHYNASKTSTHARRRRVDCASPSGYRAFVATCLERVNIIF